MAASFLLVPLSPHKMLSWSKGALSYDLNRTQTGNNPGIRGGGGGGWMKSTNT